MMLLVSASATAHITTMCSSAPSVMFLARRNSSTQQGHKLDGQKLCYEEQMNNVAPSPGAGLRCSLTLGEASRLNGEVIRPSHIRPGAFPNGG